MRAWGLRLGAGAIATLIATQSAFAIGVEGTIQAQPRNAVAIGIFAGFVGLTLLITTWAARRTKTASDFYTGGGRVSGFQNGLAIAGDYMSAASFLGISAQIFTDGYDGLIYSIGFLVGWPILMFLLAERLRNLGRYTFGDVIAYRFAGTPVRCFAAGSTLAIVVFYLIAQMVGAGQLIQLLFGLPYLYAVMGVGALMVVYVVFGGMTATTWVQTIKAVLLLLGASLMAFLVLWRVGFSPEALFTRAVQVKSDLAAASGLSPDEAAARGLSIMRPGNFLKDPISAISFGMALMFGTAGLPHILMRFFTVPNASQARGSVLWATIWIGYFYILTFVIGFGAIVFVATNPAFLAPDSGLRGGGNMAAIHLANALGGNVLLGFVSAVAFATILAVVAGLTLSGTTAISHEIYATVIRKGEVEPAKELRVSRATTLVLGLVAIGLGVLFQGQNVAFMVSLAFALAASSNFPVLLMTLLWKGCTTRGAVAGGTLGLVTAVVLTVLSPAIWVAVLHHDHAIFPYTSPALFSMAAAFAGIWVISLTDRSGRAAVDRAAFAEQRVRSETGIGVSAGVDH